jgi:hypothetical protein
MKPLGSLILSILIGIIAFVLAVKLLGAALKLVGIAIALALAVGAYFVVRKRLGKDGGRA